MNLRIERIGTRIESTWGVLQLDGVDTYFTGEFAANRIPAGEYVLKRDFTGNYRWWRMYGHGVNDGEIGHEAVEFHPMNWPRKQSRACIGIGERMCMSVPSGGVAQEQALDSSVAAFNRLLRVLGDDDHTLVIVEPVA